MNAIIKCLFRGPPPRLASLINMCFSTLILILSLGSFVSLLLL